MNYLSTLVKSYSLQLENATDNSDISSLHGRITVITMNRKKLDMHISGTITYRTNLSLYTSLCRAEGRILLFLNHLGLF